MTALVLHIGDPKTGSSSIQQALYGRRVHCDSVTLDYPDKLNAIHLANAIRKPGQAAHLDARFKAAAQWLDASTADVAVLSAEQFSSIKALQVVQVFGKYMPGHLGTMRVVGYVRPHVSRFLAAYAQRVKVGALQTDVDSFYRQMQGERFLTFYRRFKGWNAAFGPRFVLRPMIRDALFQGDVVADFVNVAVSGAAFRLSDVAQANTTLPVEALSGLRHVQQTLLDRQFSGGTRHCVGSEVNRLCGSLPLKGAKLRISARLYDIIDQASRADAAQMDATFFGRPVLTQALDQAGQDTVETNTDTDARLYFPPAVLAQLDLAANRLADQLARQPDIWKDWFTRELGQSAPLTAPPTQEAEAHVAAVNAILTDIVALITGH